MLAIMPTLWICRIAVAFTVLAAGATVPSRLRAQTTAVVQARVVDADAQTPLSGVQVRIVGTTQVTRTDSSGSAVLRSVAPGDVQLEVRRLGYEPVSMQFQVAPADTLELEIALLRVALQVDAVTVTADAVQAGLEGFDARRRRGFGQFVEPRALDAEGSREIGAVLASRLRGVRVVTGSDGVSRYVVSGQPKTMGALGGGQSGGERASQSGIPAGACVMHVYVDGVFLSDPDVSFVETRSLSAVEVYTAANVPPQFRRAGAECGVVLMWSRREPGS